MRIDASDWLVYVAKVARGVTRPVTVSREDWEAEANLALVEALGAYRPKPGDPARDHTALAPWIRRVVRRHLFNVRKGELRQRRRRPPGSLSLDGPEPGAEETSMHDVVADQGAMGANPADVVVFKDELTRWWGRMTPRQREAVSAAVCGEGPVEFGNRTGVAHQAVSDRITRGARAWEE